MKLIPSSDKPITVFDNVFMFKKGEVLFKELFDKELKTLKAVGFIKDLIKKYTGSINTFLE